MLLGGGRRRRGNWLACLGIALGRWFAGQSNTIIFTGHALDEINRGGSAHRHGLDLGDDWFLSRREGHVDQLILVSGHRCVFGNLKYDVLRLLIAATRLGHHIAATRLGHIAATRLGYIATTRLWQVAGLRRAARLGLRAGLRRTARLGLRAAYGLGADHRRRAAFGLGAANGLRHGAANWLRRSTDHGRWHRADHRRWCWADHLRRTDNRCWLGWHFHFELDNVFPRRRG